MELTALMKQVKISKKLSLSKTQTPFMESQVGEYIYSNAIHLLGFGFDGFIHRATQEYIFEHGFILPKQITVE